MSDDLCLQERYAPDNACFGCGPANAEGLRIEGVLEIDVFSDDAVAVPLPLDGGVLARADLDGVAAQLSVARPQPRGEVPPPTMNVDDVARSVLHMATLPPESNVQFMTVMATKMPYIGRG